MGVTDGLKPDGQTTSVGEEGDINKTSSPPHDFIENIWNNACNCRIYSVALTVK